MKRLAVLGASTPFTVSLLQALRDLPPMALSLHGRSVERLGLIAAHARANLDAPVAVHTALAPAVEGADFVLVQIRYGGMGGRADAERRAWALGCPADETLGPAALYVARQMAEPLEDLAEALARHAPDAWILNMINPLGVSTAALARRHPRVIGICELPHTTADRVAAELGLPGLDFRVEGLNHRSFLCVDDAVIDAIGDRDTLVGLPAAWARELGAIPTKYHRLLREPVAPESASRAAQLIGLKDRLLAELREDPARVPPSLAERVTDWYSDGVVPLLRALLDGGARVINQLDDDGVVRERLAQISPDGLTPLPGALPPAAQAWVDRFETHERAVLAAVARQTPETLQRALDLDPMLSR
ncbi:MAG: hypothetical protein H6739_32325 [Alphaproteobacteria bacterium]|nr:hypothetical protein [Alphaproteobacteria bacterium]